jgi:rare lipoprotein A
MISGQRWAARQTGFLFLVVGTAALTVLTGCGHRVKKEPEQSTAPVIREPETLPPAPGTLPPAHIPITPAPPGGVDEEDREYIASHRPILSEKGIASWYTAPYKGRKSANGQVFSDTALTAAHRTLPMGSLVVVTNLDTGQSSPMRITDRGPFVAERLIDLTVASAQAVGVYRKGSAPVRIDVYKTPKPIGAGGRWCVQIGALSTEERALRLKRQLQKKYPDAQVMEFPGEKSYWVRIRPVGDDRKQAEFIARHMHLSEGKAFLTRLD